MNGYNYVYSTFFSLILHSASYNLYEMCKRDDIKCKICSSKLCVSWCCGYAMAHFSRSIFRHFFFFWLFIRILRLPSDFASNNFFVCFAMEGDKRRFRQPEKSSLPTFGKCGCFCFLFASAVARARTHYEMDRRYGLRQNVTLFKLWKVIYYSDHNKREFPS